MIHSKHLAMLLSTFPTHHSVSICSCLSPYLLHPRESKYDQKPYTCKLCDVNREKQVSLPLLCAAKSLDNRIDGI
jgi:hypothetical protein